MLRYLHVQAEPLTADYARSMFQLLGYQMIPNQAIPIITFTVIFCQIMDAWSSGSVNTRLCKIFVVVDQ